MRSEMPEMLKALPLHSAAAGTAALRRIAIRTLWPVSNPRQTALANFPQRGYPQAMNPKLAVVTLVALVWNCLAFCGEIHDAAAAGDLEKVKALLKENPDLVSSKDDKAGETALHFAAVKGNKEVAEFLLTKRAEVDAKEIDGETPLHLAAEMGHRDVVELLLTNKANINATNRDGYTPLHAAALAGHKDVVELLLAKKAKVNAKNSNGNTPLHLAAFNGFTDVAELLVANKADINAKNNNGQTPLDEAGRTRQTNVIEWLRQHGGHE
jgi:ankyrin repeat protein